MTHLCASLLKRYLDRTPFVIRVLWAGPKSLQFLTFLEIQKKGERERSSGLPECHFVLVGERMGAGGEVCLSLSYSVYRSPIYKMQAMDNILTDKLRILGANTHTPNLIRLIRGWAYHRYGNILNIRHSHLYLQICQISFLLNQNTLKNAGWFIREWHFFHFDLKSEGLLSRDGLVQEYIS